MRSLNLDQLRTLIEVIEHGSFSAAARRLNLTQPAVSLQVRELERRFGVRLIERMGRQAHATAPGRELAEAARRIFRECEHAEAAMRRFRDGWIGRVHIGATNTAMMYDLPPVLRRLRLDHPGIELHITNMPTRDSVEHVLQNKIDLALVTLPVDEQASACHAAAPAAAGGDIPGRHARPSRQDHPCLRGAPDPHHRVYARRGARADHALAVRADAVAPPADASGHGRGAEDGRGLQRRHVDRAGRGGRAALARPHRASAAAAGRLARSR